MRVAFHQLAVLERAGLALIGVADQVARARVVFRDEGPLHAGREAGAAAPPQPGLLDHLDDVCRRDLAQHFPQRLVAARTLVVGERAGVTRLGSGWRPSSALISGRETCMWCVPIGSRLCIV